MDRLSSLHESWFSLGVSRVWGSQLQFSSEWYKLNSKESKPIDTLHAYLSPKLFHGYIVCSASNQSQLNAMILCTNSLQRWYPINLNIRAILLPSSTTAISKYCSKFVQTFVHLYVTRILLDIKKNISSGKNSNCSVFRVILVVSDYISHVILRYILTLSLAWVSNVYAIP